MDNSEVQHLLDSLDKRLALGEVDIGTYHALRAKFSQSASGSSDPVGSVVTSMMKEAVAIKCPGCMAPLPVPSDPAATSVVCEYCGGTFALKIAEAEMEALKAGIKKWIAELAGGASSGSMVDEASRSFIFREKLFPALRTAADRATELYLFSRHQPLFAFPLITSLQSSPFQDALDSAPDLGYFVDKVKDTVARTQSPEVLAFAVGATEKGALSQLETQCQETLFLTNARKQLASYSEDGLQSSVCNLRALRALYEKTATMSKIADSTNTQFADALAMRIGSVVEAIDVLRGLLDPRNMVYSEQTADKLNEIAVGCDRAAQLIEQSDSEARESVPSAESARVDASTIRLLALCVRLFGSCCGDDQEYSFSRFLDTLRGVVIQARMPASDLPWLTDLVGRLFLQIESIGGQSQTPVIHDFTWAETRAAAGARHSFFGSSESVEIESTLLVPFWIARLCFAQQKGVIFKKGHAAESLLALNASRPNGECLEVASDSTLHGDIREAINTPGSIGASHAAAVPVVSREAAAQRLKRHVGQSPIWQGGYADLQELVYLPVAVVRYSSKKDERRQVLSPLGEFSLTTTKVTKHNLGAKSVALLC